MTTSWTYGATALTTFGKVLKINDYLDMPARRGDDVLLPFRHGKTFVQKYYDSRTLVFGMAYPASSATVLETTMDTARKLFSLRTQQTLAMTMEDATVRNISAIVNRPLEIDRKSPTIVFFIVEFVCPFPFWRLSTVIADNTTTINVNPKSMTVTNPGTVEERDATIILTGPLLNTVITNSTTGVVLTYTGTIASPRVVTIATATTGEYTATTDLGVNVIGNITHTGSAALMVFNPGSNSLSIADGTSTTGTVKVTFSAPFI